MTPRPSISLHPGAPRHPALLALVLGAVLPGALAATTLTVDARPGFQDGVRSIAVVPIRCTGDLDCAHLERQAGAALRNSTGWQVIDASEVEIDRWEARERLPGNLAALATDLRVDALLTIDLLPSGAGEGFRPQWSPLEPRGLTFRKSLRGEREAIRVHLVSGETGEVLAEGLAAGRGLVRGNTDRAARQVIALLEELFGR
jgi:hypothetical protein